MHTVAVLAMDNVLPFDLTTPVDLFRRIRLADGQPAYDVRVCGEATVKTESFVIQPPFGLDALADADTIVLPGCADPLVPVPPEILDTLRDAAARGTRIVTICVGAFVLAATGLLDGMRATTHWLAAADLAARYPEIDVDPDVLYVDNGQFLTSAGATAGIDLCLHLVRRDHGSAVAAHAARVCVMPLEREGGQAQYIAHNVPPTPQGTTLEPLLLWLDSNTAKNLTLEDMAAYAGMSTRTLNRRFREQTGTTPLQWLHRTRIRQAQHLLEATVDAVDHIAGQVGFGSPTAFRERFKRVVGTSPRAYRLAFQGA
ncbi:GlxA family transcriptional regulator [Actinocrispum wychmicini]|uniref:Transcriptional regulator GlxA family with amidase domain n=1 Tax=Actinocrispum wychmicini TaxID=1213861 RepID=A0A4R2IUD2_9PSEU|nr:helix-turn-helix domain-containing protein [Actinocrispum wychmicini]TCO46465.1 transcriptional regulator GlxA family with amidase domain [Actinocrispum wychmicini]